MSAAERASLADIVAVGVVRRAFKSARSGDAAATYSAEVRLFDVFKGRRLVDSVPDRPEVRRSTSGGQTVGATRTPVIDSSGAPARVSTLLKAKFHYGRRRRQVRSSSQTCRRPASSC